MMPQLTSFQSDNAPHSPSQAPAAKKSRTAGTAPASAHVAAPSGSTPAKVSGCIHGAGCIDGVFSAP